MSHTLDAVRAAMRYADNVEGLPGYELNLTLTTGTVVRGSVMPMDEDATVVIILVLDAKGERHPVFVNLNTVAAVGIVW